MILENLANLIWTTGMNLHDIALMSEGDFELENLNNELKEDYGSEDSTNLNFIGL